MNPTYYNHPGHYEVIQLSYDPTKTSYKLLLNYYWRNVDPLDPIGQFCDKGSSYLSAIFYSGATQKAEAEASLSEIKKLHPSWDIKVQLKELTKFWEAEDYHQNYYLKNPNAYAYYKGACGRVARLETVWTSEEYHCYHDKSLSCPGFKTITTDSNSTVDASINAKGANLEGSVTLPLPTTYFVLLMVAIALVVGLGAGFGFYKLRQRKRTEKIEQYHAGTVKV